MNKIFSMLMMKKYLLILIMFLLVPSVGDTATLRYSAKFNSQSFPDTMWTGSTNAVWYDGAMHETTCPSTWCSYVSPGRDGTGFALKFAPSPYWPYMGWHPRANWPTNEIYITYWVKFENWVGVNTGMVNLKMFYFYGAGNYNHWAGAIAAAPPYSSGTEIMWSVTDDAGVYPMNGKYTPVPPIIDGKWHHYEHYLNFETKTFRTWIDGSKIVDATFPNASISNYVDTIYPFSVAGSSPSPTGNRVLDDFEVWDGMPGTAPAPVPNDSLKPNPPKILLIN